MTCSFGSVFRPFGNIQVGSSGRINKFTACSQIKATTDLVNRVKSCTDRHAAFANSEWIRN